MSDRWLTTLLLERHGHTPESEDQEVTGRCLHCTDYTFTGTTAEERAAFAVHAALHEREVEE